MKIAQKSVLGTSVLLAALVATPWVYSKEQHADGMNEMPEQSKVQMMNMDMMKDQMQGMSKRMAETDNTKDMSKQHALMQKHMTEMQEMMKQQPMLME